uniref:CCHC-type domain-containing protein n=1 Tax=Solanum lycopersicum TaxID=4081 RepID=A0A3Q7GVA1_SOLLC
MYTSRSNSRNKKPYNPNAFCEYCHMKGCMINDCHKLLKCDHCHKTGHVKLDCFRLIRYPPDFKGKRDTVVAGNSVYEASSAPYHAPQIPHKASHQVAKFWMMTMPMIIPQQHQKRLQMLGQKTIGDAHCVANMADLLNYDELITIVPHSTVSSCLVDAPSQLPLDHVVPPVRRSTRSLKPPIWHKDYITTNDFATSFQDQGFGRTKIFSWAGIARSDVGILIHQRKYDLELISNMGLAGA